VKRTLQSYPKRGVKSLNAGIEKSISKGSVHNWALLPDQLIEPWLPNFAGAVRGGVDAAISPGAAPSNVTLKRTGLPSFIGANTKCRSRLWNRNTIAPGTA